MGAEHVGRKRLISHRKALTQRASILVGRVIPTMDTRSPLECCILLVLLD